MELRNFSLFSALIMFVVFNVGKLKAQRVEILIIYIYVSEAAKKGRNFSIINYHAHEFSHVKILIRVEKCRHLIARYCGTCTIEERRPENMSMAEKRVRVF